MEKEKLDVITQCDDCNKVIGEGVVTDQDEIICWDCAEGREARFLNMIEDDYYDCREV